MHTSVRSKQRKKDKTHDSLFWLVCITSGSYCCRRVTVVKRYHVAQHKPIAIGETLSWKNKCARLSNTRMRCLNTHTGVRGKQRKNNKTHASLFSWFASYPGLKVVVEVPLSGYIPCEYQQLFHCCRGCCPTLSQL